MSAVLSAALELRGSRRVEGQRWESLDPLVWWASKLGDSPAVTGLLKAGALARWRNPDDGSSPMRAATKVTSLARPSGVSFSA